MTIKGSRPGAGVQRRIATLSVLKREDPHAVQQENIKAAQVIKSLLSTCIGPRAMAKMVLTRNNSMEITNDGNTVLREIEVTHPVIKSLIELSRTQSEEVGDGTTSVVIVAAEILQQMVPLLKERIHPVKIIAALKDALTLSLSVLKKAAHALTEKDAALKKVIRDSIGTKASAHLLVPLHEIAYEVAQIAPLTGSIESAVRIERIIGGQMDEIEIIHGVLLQKEVLHPSMPKQIDQAKVLLIDFPLEYRKGENQAHIEMHRKEAFTEALKQEEMQIEIAVKKLLSAEPTLLVSEKGICEYAISLLRKANVATIRRVKRSDLLRASLSTGAQIVSSPEDVSANVLGKCRFTTLEYNGESYCKLFMCASAKACTVLLRGPSKELLSELERNLRDAIGAARCLRQCPFVVPGAGAAEMIISSALIREKNKSVIQEKVFYGLAEALKSIPAAIIANSGCTSPRKTLNDLERIHVSLSSDRNTATDGINGQNGSIEKAVLYEPLLVKEQIIKSAIEGAIIILRVDGVVRQA